MFCSKCGNQLSGGEKFCNKCGTPVNNATNVIPTQTTGNYNNDKRDSQAMVGMILGLCSIVAWFIPLVGFPVTITGIVFSAKGLNSKSKGKAIAGLTLSIIFLVITLINSIAGAIIGSELTSRYYY